MDFKFCTSWVDRDLLEDAAKISRPFHDSNEESEAKWKEIIAQPAETFRRKVHVIEILRFSSSNFKGKESGSDCKPLYACQTFPSSKEMKIARNDLPRSLRGINFLNVDHDFNTKATSGWS